MSRPGDAAAPRLRGPGTGALLGPPRALPAAVRRGQHAGRATCTTPANYFHAAAPPDAPRLPQAAGRVDAEVAAAPQAGGLAAGGIRPRHPFHAYPDRAVELVADDKVRRVVLCTGKVYYDLLQERETREHQRTSRSSGWSSSIRSRHDADRSELSPLQERRCRLVPGRAAEHGRLGLHRPPPGSAAIVAGRPSEPSDMPAVRQRHLRRPVC